MKISYLISILYQMLQFFTKNIDSYLLYVLNPFFNFSEHPSHLQELRLLRSTRSLTTGKPIIETNHFPNISKRLSAVEPHLLEENFTPLSLRTPTLYVSNRSSYVCLQCSTKTRRLTTQQPSYNSSRPIFGVYLKIRTMLGAWFSL